MAINPIQITQPQAYSGGVDWTPLYKFGEMLQKQFEEQEGAKLLQNALERAQAQQQPAAVPQQPFRPSQVGAAAPPLATQQPPIDIAKLTPPPLETPNQRVAGGFQQYPGAPQVGLPPEQPPLAKADRLPVAPQPQIAAPPPGQIIPGAIPPRTAALQPGPTGTIQPEPQIAAPPPDQAIPGAVAQPVPSAMQPPPTQVAQPPQAPTPYPEAGVPGLDNALRVIRQKESGGNYANVTTTTNPRTGRPQSALGAYGVMDFNVGPWTKAALGRELTPDEFLRSKEAQDAVARYKFGEYAQKYGLNGAARAWLGGEGGMNRNVADAFGTTPTAYADDFSRKLGLPPEITAGTSRPRQQSSQALAFDRTMENLQTGAPAAAAQLTPKELAALYKNETTRPLAAALLQKQLSPDVYDFKVEGDNIVRYNKRDGTYSVQKLPKIMEVGEDKRLFDTGTRTYIDGGGPSDKDRYGKPQPGERWKDPNNKALGVEPVPGGQHAKIGDEIVGRVGLAQSFLSTLPEIRQRIDRGDVGLVDSMGQSNVKNHGMAMSGLGTPGETKRMMDAGAEALIRMLTGAGMSKEEATQNAEQYRLRAKDTAFVIKSKMDALERHFQHIGAVIGQGRGGQNPLTAPSAPPPTQTFDRAALERELRRRGAIQ